MRGRAVNVSRGSDVLNGKVSLDFSLINSEVEVLFGHNLFVSIVGESLLVELVLEVLENKLLLNDFIDTVLDLLDFRDVVLVCREGSESATLNVEFLQLGEILSLFSVLFVLFPNSGL